MSVARRRSARNNLLPGTLDLLILKALSTGERHGLGVARRVEQMTSGTFRVKPGSLFPSLHRMEESGWLRAEWITREGGRRARVYDLTAAGKKQLAAEESRWQAGTGAVNRVLRMA